MHATRYLTSCRHPNSARWTLVAVMVATTALLAPGLSAQTVVTVNETTPNGWVFFDDIGGMPLPNNFAVGPATPPRGSGSANIVVAGPAEGILIGTQNHPGTPLADISVLGYSTYQDITPQALSLQFNVDYDNTDGTTSWQGRLVFEPANVSGGTVLTNTWQAWDALAASARWWSSGTPVVGDVGAAAACPQASPCTWATILSTYPDIAIQSGALAGISLKAGSGWPAFDGNVDDFRIAATGAPFDIIYDFETVVPVELQSFTID